MAQEIDLEQLPIRENSAPISAPNAASRDLLRREASGAPQGPTSAEIAIGTQAERRSTSIVDQGAEAALKIQELRETRRTEISAESALKSAIESVLKGLPENVQSALDVAGLRTTAAVQAALRSLMNRLSPAQKASIEGESRHRDAHQHHDEAQAIRRKRKSSEKNEEDEALPKPNPESTDPSAVKTTLSLKIRAFLEICGEALKGVGRSLGYLYQAIKGLFEKRPNLILTDSSRPAPTETTSAPSGSSGVAHDRYPHDWVARFGEDPPSGVKKAALQISQILEEFAAARHHEEEQRVHQSEEEALDQQRKLNALRDELAKFLYPYSDGTIPLSLLSRQFVGPWVSAEDILRALDEARSARRAA